MKLKEKKYGFILKILKIILFILSILIITIAGSESNVLSNSSTVAFSFLIIVLLSAFFGDLLTAVLTSLTAAFCFDYYFLQPFGTLYIYSFADWISLAAFMLTSIIISYLNASANEKKINLRIFNNTMEQIKIFSEWLLSVPKDQLTLSATAKETLRIFSMEYCSIHIYGKGKWKHFTGSALSDISNEIESTLLHYEDHITDLMELADENLLGTSLAFINKGKDTLAILAVKSKSLPENVIETIAYMIGVRLSDMILDK